MRTTLLVWMPVLLVLATAEAPMAAQFSFGWIEGQVRSAEDSRGIGGVAVSIINPDGTDLKSVLTDTAGNYHFFPLPPDSYELKFEKPGHLGYVVRQIRVQSAHASLVDLAMQQSQGSPRQIAVGRWEGVPSNPWGTAYGSTFDRSQLEKSPSPRNIWALLENQDRSIVTNAPDEGGILTGVIARVGVHGSSWAQNGYRFDGIDVTDPFETGKPLVYPSFGSLQEFQTSTALHPSAVRFPGGSLNMTSRSGGKGLHAGWEAYYLGKALQSSNLDDRLRRLGLAGTPHFKHFGESEFTLGGPLPPSDRWFFFSSLSYQHLSKLIPDFPQIPSSTVYSGLLRFDGRLRAQDQITAVGTGQIVNNSNLGARPGVTPAATLRGNDRFEVIQGHWTHQQSPETLWHLRFGFSHTSPTDVFQHDLGEPNRTQLFTGEMTGAAPVESDSARSRFSLLLQGETWRHTHGNRWRHQFDFGLDLEESMATEERRIFRDIHLLFFPRNVPAQVVEFNTPSRTKLRLREFSLFLDDHVRLSNRLFIRLGLTLDASRAFLPAQKSDAGSFAPARSLAGTQGVLSWTTLAPRTVVSIPLRRHAGGPRLIAGFLRYYHVLPARYANFANPNSLGGQVYRWEDKNQDSDFQRGEEAGILRVFGGPYSSVDPQLRRPYTDEWILGLDQVAFRQLEINVRLFRRDEKRLVETINSGISRSAFTPVDIYDVGDDNIKGTSDDQIIRLFNQDPTTLGKDSLLLTNPAGFRSSYKGLEVGLRKELAKRGFLSISLNAYQAVGSASPGNTEFENDTGTIGTLFDDPNTLMNAHGRLFFDRAYVGKIASYFHIPFGLQVGSIIKYLDGLPFGRQLIVTGLNQGPIIVMATPRGQPGGMRTQFNLTFDQRFGRDFEFGRFRLSCLVDIFNLLNLNKNLREFDLSGPIFPLRRPLEVQNPRVVRLGVKWSF